MSWLHHMEFYAALALVFVVAAAAIAAYVAHGEGRSIAVSRAGWRRVGRWTLTIFLLVWMSPLIAFVTLIGVIPFLALSPFFGNLGSFREPAVAPAQ